VYLGSNRSGALAALAMAVALCGCAQLGLDESQPLFRKPLDFTGQSGGYTFSDVQEARRDRPVTANDLVEANGSCPPQLASQAQPVSGNQVASPAGAPMASPSNPSSLGEAVALGMTECEVVYRAGQPTNVQLGKNPNGNRTAVLTFQSGPRPAIYHFERGRLMQMDSVEGAAPPPQAAKKKPAKPKAQQKRSSQT
jgi:hypothetical protein